MEPYILHILEGISSIFGDKAYATNMLTNINNEVDAKMNEKKNHFFE